MRRLLLALLLSAALCWWASSADQPGKWRSWHYSRTVEGRLAPGTNSLVEIPLPWEIYEHCQPGCVDLRIVDSRDEEVPYVLESSSAEHHSESHRARIVENSLVAGNYTQIIGDLGEGYAAYDRVKVETDRPDFIVWAEVALSDDARAWRIVEGRAPIARFRSREVDGTQTIPFAGLSSRYVRVRIADPSGKFPVGGLSVLLEKTEDVGRTAVSITFKVEPSVDQTVSVWRANLATANQPISALKIETDTPEFYRAVRLSASEDGQEWSYRASGVIYRYQQGNRTRESLRIEFPEYTVGRLIRAEVINANDQPLTHVALTLSAVPRTLVLKANADRQYRLIYGNQKALRPEYDLAHFLDSGHGKPAYLRLSLGAEEVARNYRDPRPFTERHPEVLWSALGVAIILIGLTALKTMRAAGTTQPRS
jgi:hypothetical protein